MLNQARILTALLVLSLTASAVQAGPFYSNGDFEDDISLVPNAGDRASVLPTGWQFDDYGNGVAPKLRNISHVGGDVAVSFPNKNQGSLKSALTRFESGIVAGDYTFTITTTGRNLQNNQNWLIAELWWTDDALDPWAGDYGYIDGTDWIRLDPDDNGVWQTHVVDFTVSATDPVVGKFIAPWIEVESNNGHILLGEATLTSHTPAPASVLVLACGMIGLVSWRRKKMRARSA